MPVFIVWVYPAMSCRYIDSIWADHDHAAKRYKELKSSMAAAGNPETGMRHTLFIQEGEVADAALVDKGAES